MNPSFVLDTMALVLRLENRALPPTVKLIFETAEKGDAELFIPVMVLVEVGYLAERKRIETNLKEVHEYCKRYTSVRVTSLTEDVVGSTFEITDIPELHDRIIAAHARVLNAPLVSNDPKIDASKFVSVVWGR